MTILWSKKMNVSSKPHVCTTRIMDITQKHIPIYHWSGTILKTLKEVNLWCHVGTCPELSVHAWHVNIGYNPPRTRMLLPGISAFLGPDVGFDVQELFAIPGVKQYPVYWYSAPVDLSHVFYVQERPRCLMGLRSGVIAGQGTVPIAFYRKQSTTARETVGPSFIVHEYWSDQRIRALGRRHA